MFLIYFLSRCFIFGIGEGASTALIKGVARAGRGTAVFVSSKDRLQAKVARSTKTPQNSHCIKLKFIRSFAGAEWLQIKH